MSNLFKFLAAFALSYLWHGMGTTIGYHRLLAHRSFKCSKALEYFWVLGGYLGFQGSPIWWTAIHRAHHKYTDTALDPHSPRFGLKSAYYGWMTETTYSAHTDPAHQCPDLISDPLYSYLDRSGRWHRAHLLATVAGLTYRAALWRLFGWRIALASALSGVAVMQIPLLLNVVCHIPRLGYQTYARDDDAVNVWWVALLAHGEGWHNNHHAFPSSARSGLGAREFDLSWMTLKVMRAFGLAKNLNEPSLAKQNQGIEKATVK